MYSSPDRAGAPVCNRRAVAITPENPSLMGLLSVVTWVLSFLWVGLVGVGISWSVGYGCPSFPASHV